jgi:hypothetical protein
VIHSLTKLVTKGESTTLAFKHSTGERTVEFEAGAVLGLTVDGDAHVGLFGLGQFAPVQEDS